MFSRINNVRWCVALCTVALAGCASSTGTTSSAGWSGSGESGKPVSRPAPVRSSRILAELSPRGSVPYDMQSLPLVSPDGRYIVTQTHVAPTWPTVLAKYDADVPLATRVEIYALSTEGLSFVTTLNEPVLLGRSFDDEGFLVEAPQDDGSRWIGRASWRTGDIHWLVADEYVNAFASIGPDGRLAWNRRDVHGPEDVFDLVIRHGEREWIVPGQDESWLMPTWSGRGDELFALVLRQGQLDATFIMATNEAALRQSRRSIRLCRDATVYSAYQTIGAHVNSPSLHSCGRFVFHHPAQARMAVWNPRESSVTSLTLFDTNTFAALLDGEDHALLTTDKRLIRQCISDARDRRDLIAGIQIPRVTASDAWPYILLTPQDNTIGITAMQQLR